MAAALSSYTLLRVDYPPVVDEIHSISIDRASCSILRILPFFLKDGLILQKAVAPWMSFGPALLPYSSAPSPSYVSILARRVTVFGAANLYTNSSWFAPAC
jgi:hypothetical protein